MPLVERERGIWPDRHLRRSAGLFQFGQLASGPLKRRGHFGRAGQKAAQANVKEPSAIDDRIVGHV